MHEDIIEIDPNETYTITSSDIEKPTINFNNEQNKSVGTLYWEDGLMKFKGEVHKSAKILFDYVCAMYNKQED